MAELSWTDTQRQTADAAVREAFEQTTVARPLFDGFAFSGSGVTVCNERLTQADNTVSLQVDHDSLNLRFVNLRVFVELSSEQVADEKMTNALLAFRRAGKILAQEEDRIVFDGYQRGGIESGYVANVPRPQKGLADPLERMKFEFIDTTLKSPSEIGSSVVPAVVKAIRTLEDNSNPGPFACILGNKLYDAVYTPEEKSLVLPKDRIAPIVNGPVVRSGQMNESTGIVVSRSAGAVDIVVGTRPTVDFLRRTDEGKFLFRVYERIVMRLRDDGSRPPVAGFITGDISSAQQAVAGAAIKTVNASEKLADAGKKIKDAIDHVIEAAKH